MSDPFERARPDSDSARTWKVCSICRVDYQGYGHNAQPINDGRCCSDCNQLVTIARLREIIRKEGKK